MSTTSSTPLSELERFRIVNTGTDPIPEAAVQRFIELCDSALSNGHRPRAHIAFALAGDPGDQYPDYRDVLVTTVNLGAHFTSIPLDIHGAPMGTAISTSARSTLYGITVVALQSLSLHGTAADDSERLVDLVRTITQPREANAALIEKLVEIQIARATAELEREEREKLALRGFMSTHDAKLEGAAHSLDVRKKYPEVRLPNNLELGTKRSPLRLPHLVGIYNTVVAEAEAMRVRLTEMASRGEHVRRLYTKLSQSPHAWLIAEHLHEQHVLTPQQAFRTAIGDLEDETARAYFWAGMLLPNTHINTHMFSKLAAKETITVDGFSISLSNVPFCFCSLGACAPVTDQAGPTATKSKPQVKVDAHPVGGGHDDANTVPTDDDEKYSRDFAMKPGNMIPAWPIYEVMTACHNIITTFTHGGQAQDALRRVHVMYPHHIDFHKTPDGKYGGVLKHLRKDAYVLAPYNVTQNHWVLLAITRTSIYFFDSLRAHSKEIARDFANELGAYIESKLGTSVRVSQGNTPQQERGSNDCALWVMRNALTYMSDKGGTGFRTRGKWTGMFSREWLRQHLAIGAHEATASAARQALQKAIADILGTPKKQNSTAGVDKADFAGKDVCLVCKQATLARDQEHEKGRRTHICSACDVAFHARCISQTVRGKELPRHVKMVRDWKCQDCAKPMPQKVRCGQRDCKYDGGQVVIAQANHCTGCDMYFHKLHVSGQNPKPFLCSACRGTTRGRGKAPSSSPSSTPSSHPPKPASTASSSPSSSPPQPSAAPLPEPPKVPPTAQPTKAPTKVPMKAPAKPVSTTSAPATPVTTPAKVPFKVPMKAPMKVPAQPPAPAVTSQASPPTPPPPKPPSPSPSPEPQQPGFHQSQT
eukprot:PhM_4_TR1256/c2_g1_i3/m.81176